MLGLKQIPKSVGVLFASACGYELVMHRKKLHPN